MRVLRATTKKDAQPYDINDAGMIGGTANGKAAVWKTWNSAPTFLPAPGMTKATVRFLSPTGTYALGTAVGGTALDPITYLIRWKHDKIVAKRALPLGFQIANFWGSDAFNKSSVVGAVGRPAESGIPVRVSVKSGVHRYDTRYPSLRQFVANALSGKAVAGSAVYTVSGAPSGPRMGVVIAPDGTAHWPVGATNITHLDGDTALGTDADHNVIVYTCVFAAPTTPVDSVTE